MTATAAAKLAELLDENFEEIADMYADAITDGRGLEGVIADLHNFAKVTPL